MMRPLRPVVSKLLRSRPVPIFLLLLCGATTAFAAEVVHSFDSTVRVAKDGELTVTEAIRVEAEGREIRHGIYRDFPLTFKDAGGKVREVDFKLLGVEPGRQAGEIIRRRIFRRHLRTIFRIGVSAATSGALSRRPPCRSRCAGFCASMTRAAR